MKRLDEILSRLEREISVDVVGARSLSGVAVVVPTAQSARRLRLGLSRRFGAILPPEIMTSQVLLNEGGPGNIATRTDELLALYQAMGEPRSVSQAGALADVRRILSTNALSFADVAGKCEAENERWVQLSAVEERYLKILSSRSLKDVTTAIKENLETLPVLKRLRGKGVSRIIVTCADSLPPAAVQMLQKSRQAGLEAEWFEFSGLDRSEKDSKVEFCKSSTLEEEAEKIALLFSSVEKGDELPALCVASSSSYAKLQCAFESHGLKLHNPSSTRLAASSLGRLVLQLVELAKTDSYRVFSSFVRSGDVRRWLCSSLAMTGDEMTGALVCLDKCQAEALPEKTEDIRVYTAGKLRAIFEFLKTALRKKRIRGVLQSIFKEHILDESDETSREFAAAAEKVSEVLDECDAIEDCCADESLYYDILLARLKETSYSLECDQGDVIMSDGFMELPYLDADEVVIAGFQESAVPETVMSHPFLPNSLRKKLGLACNETRCARDRAIFERTILERERGGVKVFFHTVESNGEFVKPSQFVFDTDDDEVFKRRVKEFYRTGVDSRTSEKSEIPDNWKLDLPVPPAFEKLLRTSPSRIDDYLRCPFTYYLKDKNVLGDDRSDDAAQELAAYEYGDIAHKALERWGDSELKDSVDAVEISEFLRRDVDDQLVERFHTAIPAVVALQGESIKRRLKAFAAIQAQWRREGWRIVSTEKRLEVGYGHTRVNGKCDRIDYNEKENLWCVIDYKTWDKSDKAAAFKDNKAGETVWTSLQLPVYCAMLDACAEEPFAKARLENIVSCYCVLGESESEVCFSPKMGGGRVGDAEEKIREIIDRIEHGIFWPCAKTREWQWSYSQWLDPDPAETVCVSWISDQERRISEYMSSDVDMAENPVVEKPEASA